MCRVDVFCDFTRPGDEVAIVGNCPTLGSWNTDRALPMKTQADTFPFWFGQVPTLPAGTEFKLIVRSRSHMAWEPFDGNRHWPQEANANGAKLCLKYGVKDSVNVERVGAATATAADACVDIPDNVNERVRAATATAADSCVDIPDNLNERVEETPDVGSACVDRPCIAHSLSRARLEPTLVHKQQSKKDVPSATGDPTIKLQQSRLYWADSPPSPKTPTTPTPSSTSSRRQRFSITSVTSNFIFDNVGDIGSVYDVHENKVVGEGCFGTVITGQNKKTRVVRAIKRMPREKLVDADTFRKEVEIMKLMDHPHVIKLFETFEDVRNVHLVMELCSGGDLFDRVAAKGRLTEAAAAVAIQQILSGVYHMHSRHSVCHRDLKLENFLLTTQEPLEVNTLKIIDFGLSAQFTPGEPMTLQCGTPSYVSPEVLDASYDETADLWSCGVVLYALLSGRFPFDKRSDNETFCAIRRGTFSFEHRGWESVSEHAKEFIQRLLVRAPMRLTAAQAPHDVWLQQHSTSRRKSITSAVGQRGMSCLMKNIRDSSSQSAFKKAVLQLIAFRFASQEQLEASTKAFNALDRDGDGVLTMAEFASEMRAKLETVPSDLDHLIEDMDTNGSGVIDFTEFLACTLDKSTYLDEDLCQAAFKILDKDGDGKLSIDEITGFITDALDESREQSEARQLIFEADLDGDGFIDFAEFKAILDTDISQTLHAPMADTHDDEDAESGMSDISDSD